MNLRLCFGTFVNLLDLCRQNILQEKLIGDIVEIVDSSSRYKNDKTACNKLKKCKINFVFSTGCHRDAPSLVTVTQNIKTKIAPFIDEDKKATVILMLLYIIQNEFKNGDEEKENFKKYFYVDREHMLTQKDFLFSEFISKVLLYTLYSDIDNRIGQECVKVITSDFIKEKTNPYINDYQWNASVEKLTLSYREAFTIFNKALDNHAVIQFIEKTDPTNQMQDECIENCESFLNFIHDEIWVPFGKNTIGTMLKLIQNFSNILDEYITYLGCNMKYRNNTSIFVPCHRDERPEWETKFGIQVYNYRKKLISEYDKICHYILFEPMN